MVAVAACVDIPQLFLVAQPLDRGGQRGEQALPLGRRLRRQLGGPAPDLCRLAERREPDARGLGPRLTTNPAKLGSQPGERADRLVCASARLRELTAQPPELAIALYEQVRELVGDPLQLNDPPRSALPFRATGGERLLPLNDRLVDVRAPVSEQGPLEVARRDDETLGGAPDGLTAHLYRARQVASSSRAASPHSRSSR